MTGDGVVVAETRLCAEVLMVVEVVVMVVVMVGEGEVLNARRTQVKVAGMEKQLEAVCVW